MSYLRIDGDYNNPSWTCKDGCERSFQIVWSRQYKDDSGPQFCPFCGDEWDEIVEEFDEPEETSE